MTTSRASASSCWGQVKLALIGTLRFGQGTWRRELRKNHYLVSASFGVAYEWLNAVAGLLIGMKERKLEGAQPTLVDFSCGIGRVPLRAFNGDVRSPDSSNPRRR
ncbi:hypothetical protein CBOM_07382 [Ceraceosorus bombacis]|uniref:Uncharacterized protein n=1 Tax=Ceraceosorus bombacis TaxID=401625 RepID=A0A0N7L961_9BASI|nr:hypothetical protein CBOM_07382 [Ceraceosorus bombacis]